MAFVIYIIQLLNYVKKRTEMNHIGIPFDKELQDFCHRKEDIL